MSTTTTVLVAAVLAIFAVAILAAALRFYRSQQLKTRFGPEYDRAMEETGRRAEAERLLESRVERRRHLQIRDMSPPEVQRYAQEWRAVQSRFVDDPKGAVEDAETLVTRLLRDRGYPTEDFEQQAADVSVDHAATVGGYRQAHGALLSAARGDAATDDLRQAMVHYRDLVEQLLDEPVPRGNKPVQRGNGSSPDAEPVDRQPSAEHTLAADPSARAGIGEEPAADTPTKPVHGEAK
jgi:hypothetical protein